MSLEDLLQPPPAVCLRANLPLAQAAQGCLPPLFQGTVLCDIILLNFLKGADQYKAKKFEEVSGVSGEVAAQGKKGHCPCHWDPQWLAFQREVLGPRHRFGRCRQEVVWPRVGSVTIPGALRVVTANIPIHSLSPSPFPGRDEPATDWLRFLFSLEVCGRSPGITQTCHSAPNGLGRGWGLSHGVLARSQSSIMQPSTCRWMRPR